MGKVKSRESEREREKCEREMQQHTSLLHENIKAKYRRKKEPSNEEGEEEKEKKGIANTCKTGLCASSLLFYVERAHARTSNDCTRLYERKSRRRVERIPSTGILCLRNKSILRVRVRRHNSLF